MRRISRLAALAALALLAGISTTGRTDTIYLQSNLVSDIPGLAANTDPNLQNPWGISFSSASPFWVSNQRTGTSTLYNGSGQPFPPGSPLVVTIPTTGTGPQGPTGQVNNGTNDFVLSDNRPASFIFANLNGTISAWNNGLGTMAEVVVPSGGAVYTGLASGTIGPESLLYAADSRNGKIDVFRANFAPVTLAGAFTDPNLPATFTPYNIQNLGGMLVVTYESRTAGGGVVDAFDLNGNFLRRIAANGEGGPLDDPWGVVRAPSSFGQFGGALLVGNEGDGRISAFDPLTGAFLGQLQDASGHPIENPGLWGLAFGTGANGFDPDTLYFAAGINGEQDGLFGSISAVPEPSTLAMGSISILTGLGWWWRRRASLA